MSTWQDALKGAAVDEKLQQTTCRIEGWKKDALVDQLRAAGIEAPSENAAINMAVNFYLEAHGINKPAAPTVADVGLVLDAMKESDPIGYAQVLRQHIDSFFTMAKIIKGCLA